jgi:hypothetical protein
MDEAERERCLLPPDVLLADWPAVTLEATTRPAAS